jgi:dihydroorotase
MSAMTAASSPRPRPARGSWIAPGRVCRLAGATCTRISGTAGETNFHVLREYVIEPHAETIKAFLNIASIGRVACNRVSELIDLRTINLIFCIKMRASGVIVGVWGITPAKSPSCWRNPQTCR